jgi:hypothetical protein
VEASLALLLSVKLLLLGVNTANDIHKMLVMEAVKFKILFQVGQGSLITIIQVTCILTEQFG